MREVVVSSEDLEEMREDASKRSEEDTEHELANEPTNGKIKWENLFPRMVLRVLLVEADDSTRQIISALLRKCSYRVAAVSDGLKAWEVLRGNPHNIDLILTEVDLPSISGYALLTLIMEHDVCKNTPVIMMSSHDSVNTVYKCMLRGAADYLVKPLRRNELRNLWQHVWRRQSLINGNVETIKHDKVEGTSENNAASNYASEDLTVQRCKDHDDLSTCTKPETESDTPGTEYPEPRTDCQPSSLLELSLRGGHVNESEERNRLKHSSASAFTRYTSKPSLIVVDKQTVVSTEEMTLTNYGAIFRSVYSTQPGESACLNPRSPGDCAENASTSCRANESEHVKEHGNEGDQSATSSFCNAPENVFGHCGSTHRSVQREAALMKFRMKRKDRCYEKKVRYESRKKLAEQRPRVKGQFVRQQEVGNPSKVTN